MAVKKWRGKKGKRTYAVCPMSERGGKCRLAPYAFCGISCFLHMRQSQIISRTYAPRSPCAHAHIFFGADNCLFCRVRAYKPPAPLSIFNGVKNFFYMYPRAYACARIQPPLSQERRFLCRFFLSAAPVHIKIAQQLFVCGGAYACAHK